jgi:type 1 glutamine amidotransferase
MALRLLITAIFCFLIILPGCDDDSDSSIEVSNMVNDISVLIFSKTAGWRHDSIEAGREAIKKLGSENSFKTVYTEDATHFNTQYLSEFDTVIFLNTSGSVFNEDQRNAFRNYIQKGGGFVGVHSASDTEKEWAWYGQLVGAYFDNHPDNPGVREAVIEVADSTHLSTEFLPEQWVRNDEWYNFGYFYEGINVLLKLDTESYEGSEHPGNHPIAWYHDFDGGRSFYTALGHTVETYSEELFLKHLLGGILYSIQY